MTRTARALVIAAAAAGIAVGIGLPAIGRDAQSASGSATATDAASLGRKAIERSALAYQKAKALTDVMHLEIGVPDEEVQKLDIEFAFGDGTDSYVKLPPGMIATASGKQVFVTMDGTEDKYVETPLEEDLGRTLSKLFGGDANLPVQFDMRAKRGLDVYVKGLGMGMFEEAEITGFETIVDKEGRSLEQVTIASTNGESRVGIDAKTHFVREIHLEGNPPGAPAEFQITLTARFEPKLRKTAKGLIAFEKGDRKMVEGLGELQPPPPTLIAAGDEAPDFTLENLDGETVTLSDLQGSVVVLDFWATWCPPCRKGLPLLQKFEAWANDSTESIVVYAVNTFERSGKMEATRKSTGAYWAKNKFTMPTLLDVDSSIAASYKVTSIPVTVVIGPDGTVGAVHLGFDANMVDTLKRDVAKLLPSGG